MSEQLLKQILDELKGIKEENERLTNLESKQQIISEQNRKLTEYHTETMSQFEQLATKDDLDYFDKRITQHDREIFKIKK